MNPDEMPVWFAIPTATVLWVIWLAPILRERRRARRHQ